MPKYLWLVTILLIGCTFFITGCDDMDKMIEPVLTDTETPVDLTDVLIYIGSSWWITLSDAAIEAEIAKNLLQSAGIQAGITEDEAYVREWMLQTTADGAVNVLILYGILPSSIYPPENVMPDGSVVENWIETTDGNTILNHADYLGYWSTSINNLNELVYLENGPGTLQNLMDNPRIFISVGPGSDNIPMFVTTDSSTLTPSLVNFESDRPFRLDQLQGDWFAEKILASNTGDTQATWVDPVVLRDGNLGRIAIVHQTSSEDNPKGEVAAEIIINYLLNPNVELYVPSYVAFPDPNLRTAVQEALGLASRDAITPEMLQTLTQLDAWDREITDLTGLEYATQLKVVNLHNNVISDISPLEGLTQLTELSLSYNEISDISPIAGLTQLTELVLYENQISDISPIAGLTQLTLLGLRDNQITNIRPITGLTQLTVLDLYGNNIIDINPIAALVNLEFLFLEEDPITFQPLLETNPNLQINIDTNN